MASSWTFFAQDLTAIFLLCVSNRIAVASEYTRPGPGRIVLTKHKLSGSSPQQVHVSAVGANHMNVAYITIDSSIPSKVEYGKVSSKYNAVATGDSSQYTYFDYTSGKIHNVKIGPLEPDTLYYYRCGGVGNEFSFKTAPASLPIVFAVVGDLGQTEDTASTLKHISKSKYDMLLLPGDLSYADGNQSLWDSFGLLIQSYASSRPWMVTEGNHEREKSHDHQQIEPFIAYSHRWRMPYRESGSTSNLYYSFDVAGAVHVIMLGSYAQFGPHSDQYKWLVSDLSKVDRSVTPWLIVLLHAPWYNTNEAHQGEGEDMRKAMEALLYGGRVDIVFAGHVHAYERFTRIYNNAADSCGPVYITISDGGNREGLALDFDRSHKSASLSMFREASFGHGQLKIIDRENAHWSWHRNDDSDATVSDELHLKSLSSSNACQGGTKSKDEL
ncbi:Purple acid phosphatase [Rhynchospora pubera]|uniref:Purple acid phosphatase n=1 Tax=Rhynchospora pubera TaxID=906938 RepID=A0AAV8HWM7_9POAL|nr:Purple acid phosphatase [Rhynchospora pubera]